METISLVRDSRVEALPVLNTAMWAHRRAGLRRLVIILPLLLFVVVNFIVPITVMLLRAVENPELRTAMPQTAQELREWNGSGLPPADLVRTFSRELGVAETAGALGDVANRLNFDTTGFRTLLFRTARRIQPTDGSLSALSGIDARWGDRETWLKLKRAAAPVTSFYLLAAIDRRIDADGSMAPAPPDQAVFLEAFGRTLWIGAVVTCLCLLLGYPVAYLLSTLPARVSNLLMIVVLLPFWTSILVRTVAWIVLLQTHGVVNDTLLGLHAVTHPLDLVYNRTGVYIAMTHVLLPYAILPIYAVMKGISPMPLRAALSLGATPARVFWTVFAPQTLPGVTAGGMIVFVLALGYYITPALVGGPRDQMISYFIAYFTNQSLNWGMAAALSLVLLVATLALVLLYSRLTAAKALGWR